MSQFIEMFGNNVSKKKISDVCDVRGGSTPTRTTKEFWNNGTISWFTVEDIYEQGRYITETKQHITKLATKKCFIYPVDTVLICCTASVGEYAITKKEMASNQQFNGMMIKDKSELHPEYLLYVASTLKEDLLRQAGKTTINFVSRSKLENIEIPVPPYSEQLGFVSVYRQADKSGFDGRKSQFIEMFGTIDEPKVEVKKLIDVVFSSGQYGSNTSATDYQEGKPRYIRITDINDDGSLNDDIKTAEVIEDKYRLIPGDIVFARTGATVGKTYMHETGNAIYAGYLIKYQMNESKMKPAFMKAFTHSKTYYNWVANSQKVGAQPNISAAQYDNMPVLVPQIEKQEEFLAICHQADKSGSVLQHMIAC